MTTDPRTDHVDDALVERLAAHLERGPATAADQAVPAGFQALSDELGQAATWGGPPPELRESILAQVLAGSGGPVGARPASVGPTVAGQEPTTRRPAGSRRAGWRVGWRRLAWAVPVAALAAAVFTTGVLVVDRALQPDPPRGDVYPAAGSQLAPQAKADVSVLETGSGFSIVIAAKDLPAAAPGSYYAAWLRGPRGVVAIGSFHWRRTGVPVELWSGVDPAEYPELTITLQAEGDPPTPSQLVVLTATLRR